MRRLQHALVHLDEGHDDVVWKGRKGEIGSCVYHTLHALHRLVIGTVQRILSDNDRLNAPLSVNLFQRINDSLCLACITNGKLDVETDGKSLVGNVRANPAWGEEGKGRRSRPARASRGPPVTHRYRR